MKTIVLEEPERLTTVDREDPGGPVTGEALVAVRRVAVCGTDLHAFLGNQTFFTYPRVLGHELAVEVLETGPGVSNVAPGDVCAVEPYLDCGACVACRAGRPNCCASLRVLGVHVDGGLCERLRIPARKLHPSKTLGLDALALVEMLCVGAHAVGRAALEPGSRALVIGAGPIGLGVMAFAHLAGAGVIALDVDPARLEHCRRALGVELTVVAGEGADRRVEELTGGDRAEAVFDATGSPASMAAAFGHVGHGGRLVLVGHANAEISFSDPLFHAREMTLLASRNARPDEFTRVIAALEKGLIDPGGWITHRATFDDLVGAFPAFARREGGLVKAIVDLR
ncbi:MAG: zinc-binding alcohol dehydrogenase family protein [Acidobacteriota bacterium]